jgi:hypothetical protein
MCPAAYSARPSKGGSPAAFATLSCQRTSSRTGGFVPARSLASSDAEMMAFMATILAQGVAAASRSDYSARPDSLDHEAYGIEHMLYS